MRITGNSKNHRFFRILENLEDDDGQASIDLHLGILLFAIRMWLAECSRQLGWKKSDAEDECKIQGRIEERLLE